MLSLGEECASLTLTDEKLLSKQKRGESANEASVLPTRRLPEKFVSVERNVKSSDRKVKFVMYLFSDGPKEYDFLLRMLSLGRDRYWRRKMMHDLHASPGERVLDVACGTGLVSFDLASSMRAQVVGVDVTREMLTRAIEITRERDRERHDDLDVDFIQARAENLPLRDATFACSTISLAMRNVSSIPSTIREMKRCVRNGGSVASLDFTIPRGKVFGSFYDFYIFHLLPALGLVISRHWSGIFSYLAASIRRSKSPEQIADIMRACKLGDISMTRMTRGVMALVVGRNPREGAS